MHLAWYCPKTAEFWDKVMHLLQAMMEVRGEITPKIALLGYTKTIPKSRRRLTNMALLLTKLENLWFGDEAELLNLLTG